MSRILETRNFLAEVGIELTPDDAKRIISIFDSLYDYAADKLEEDSRFIDNLDNLTTDERLDVIEELEDYGINITLKEFTAVREVLTTMCENLENEC